MSRAAQTLRIGKKSIGPGAPVFIIAEIGTSHGGDIDTAEELIRVAGESGADCVKFQAVIADEIIHPLTGAVRLPGGDIPLFDVFRSVERDAEFYRALKNYAEDAGLEFLCSPFGLRSARMLREIGVKAVKIASPETNHYPLLDEVREWRIPVLISTGVSLLGDIEKALSHLPEQVAILHCVTSYPAPETDYNAQCIKTLNKCFGKIAGVSDHSLDPVIVPVLSVLCGAAVVEKHITLDRSGNGLDDPVALNPKQFSQMTDAIRLAENTPKDECLSALKSEYGAKKVSAILGDGVKHLAESERGNYGTTNRSIIAIRPIKAGSLITREDVALLRSEKNLSPGLAPEFFSLIIGKRAARDIADATGLSWDDVMR